MFKEKKKFKINNEDRIDNIFFILVSATAFAACLTHWLLDVVFKYKVDHNNGADIDFNHVFIVAAVASLYYLYKKKSIRFDMVLALLCQTMVLVAIQDYHNELYDEVSYAWILPIAYIIGKLAIGTNPKTVNYRIIFLFFSMAVPAYIVSVTDFGANMLTGWSYGTEHWPSFWTGGFEARTTYEYGFVLMTSSLGFFLLYFKRHKLVSLLVFTMEILALYFLICAEGRQNPILVIITMMITFSLVVYDRWNSIGKSTKKKIYYGIFGIIVFVIVVGLMFQFNVAGLKDIYNKSYWSAGGLLKNERFLINWMAFKHMLKYPLIDYSSRYGYYYAHSLVLEYGRIYDLATWGFLTIIRLLLFVQAFKVAFRKSDNSWIKYLIFPAFICINIYYTMEPNGAVHRYFWMMGLVISGMIKGWLELEEENDRIRKMDKKIF